MSGQMKKFFLKMSSHLVCGSSYGKLFVASAQSGLNLHKKIEQRLNHDLLMRSFTVVQD